MNGTLTHQILEAHLREGTLEVGEEIGIDIDQTLTQDATGTLVMLELEAMGLVRTQARVSAQYVDHNLIQQDHKNPDDHLFLRSAAKRFGLWFSRPGNGVSHPLHMSFFGRPGATLLGSDSHSCAAGALGMLGIGAGGIEVALAIAGSAFYLPTPAVFGVRLVGELPPGTSAKDVILEMLRRHGVRGGVGRVIEYFGPGVANLDVWDRHVIANMGAELGATGTVFPSDERTREFLGRWRREDEWSPRAAREGADYDFEDTIDLAAVVPLVARPSSPGDVVPVEEVAGTEIHQAYIGSSANPSYRDFAIAAEIVRLRQVHRRVSFDINPSTRAVLEDLTREGYLFELIRAGARIHQAGCNGCIGMGQAPASGRNSLRTVPRNFPGRSGTPEDSVWLCSPETAAVSALHGVITDPRTDERWPIRVVPPRGEHAPRSSMLEAPPTSTVREDGERFPLVRGPNIQPLPRLDPPPDVFAGPVLLRVGDDVSTDEIMPAGAEVLPFRSNVPAISEFCFRDVDGDYVERTSAVDAHAIVAGENYGQGSSREHAALAPRYLGLRVVIAKSFARIHWQNLVSFGVLPLVFEDASDADQIDVRDRIEIEGIHALLDGDGESVVAQLNGAHAIPLIHDLSMRQREVLRAGGVIPWMRGEARGEGGLPRT